MKKSKLEGNPVDHPAHYTSHPSGIEAIVFCEKMQFCIGSAFKYLYRLDKKWDSIEDLRKALWYINREEYRQHHHTSNSSEVFESLDEYWHSDWDLHQDRFLLGAWPMMFMEIEKVVGDTPTDIDKAMYYLWWYGLHHTVFPIIKSPLLKAKLYINREIKRREESFTKTKKGKK